MKNFSTFVSSLIGGAFTGLVLYLLGWGPSPSTNTTATVVPAPVVKPEWPKKIDTDPFGGGRFIAYEVCYEHMVYILYDRGISPKFVQVEALSAVYGRTERVQPC